MVCTTVTTICGVWLAYGEPPNLIMKANLHPYLGNAFFLRYCAPGRRRHLSRHRLAAAQAAARAAASISSEMDVIDANAEDVRFLQATRHGEVMTPVELVEAPCGHLRAGRRASSSGCGAASRSASRSSRKMCRWRRRAAAAGPLRDARNSPTVLDRHYMLDAAGRRRGAMQAEQWPSTRCWRPWRGRRRRAQLIGALALVPFIGAADRCTASIIEVPAVPGVVCRVPGRDCRHRRHPEDARAGVARGAAGVRASTTSCFRLFLSITLLTQAGFFERCRG